MANTALNEQGQGATASTRPRRALVCAGPSVAVMIERQLAGAGYATVISSAGDAMRIIPQFSPSIVVIALHNGMDGERVALARRLRAEASTYALPIVFLFHKDERTQRSAALQIGVDDYFPLSTPAGEMCARLDALFWRAEAGRRAAPVAGEQRAEIDNFMLLLDTVRADMQTEGARGTLALVEALAGEAGSTGGTTGASGAGGAQGAGGASGATRAATLKEAHGFLKLNLRRADSVAFYGPTTLLVYLPRMRGDAARTSLSQLREEFDGRSSGGHLAVGLASFPDDASEIETLVERAESAIAEASAPGATRRVVATNEVAVSNPPEAIHASTVEPPHASSDERASEQQHASAQPEAGRESPAKEASASPASEASAQSASEHQAARPASLAEIAAREAELERHVRAEQEQRMRAQQATQQVTRAEPNARGESGAQRQAFSDSSVVRESRDAGAYSFSMPSRGHASHDRAAVEAAEAGAREMERRARGEVMPRRLLLTISDPARMAQLNLLIRAAGYDVRAAFDAPQALNLLRIERPDLVVLDYELQGMNGVEALRRLRQQSGGRLNVPVVLLLEAKHQGAGREALEAGARAVVNLPYDAAEFLDTVRRAGSVE